MEAVYILYCIKEGRRMIKEELEHPRPSFLFQVPKDSSFKGKYFTIPREWNL